MKVAVIGAGYVGMSTAIILGQNNDVVVYDVDPQKVECINCKNFSVFNEEINKYLLNGKVSVHATDQLLNVVCDVEYIIIAVPTNLNFESNCLDTSIIETVIIQIAEMNSNATIVIKSTVPIGFTANLTQKYNNVKLIFSPEFLREKSPLYDMLNPNRIIVGLDKNDPVLYASAEKYCLLLKESCISQNVPILFTSYSEAESIKLFSNTYLAMRVAFFNELDSYAEKNNLDPSIIIDGICLDPRIGPYYNNPSFGYGGYCLPKDTTQLNQNMNEISHSLIEAINKSNEERIQFVTEQVLKRPLSVIGFFRLGIKNYSRDMKNSVMVKLIQSLHRHNNKVIVYEPLISEKHIKSFEVVNDLKVFKDSSDIIIANRYDMCLNDVGEKVYTRDIFYRD